MADRLEQVNALIAGATAGDPDQVAIELPFDRFDDAGAALDVATKILSKRGYRLVRIVGQPDRWAARYERK